MRTKRLEDHRFGGVYNTDTQEEIWRLESLLKQYIGITLKQLEEMPVEFNKLNGSQMKECLKVALDKHPDRFV